MTRLLAKLEPWTAVSALLGLISKVQSYARAWGILLIYYQMDSSSHVGQVYQWSLHWLCSNYGNQASQARIKPLPICQAEASNGKPPARWLQGPHVSKMIRLLAKLEPWTAVSALLGLISKVQSYARAWGTLLIYYQMDNSSFVGQVYQWSLHWLCNNHCVRACVRACVSVCEGDKNLNWPFCDLVSRMIRADGKFFHLLHRTSLLTNEHN